MSIISRRSFAAGGVALCASGFGSPIAQALIARPQSSGKLLLGVNLAGAEFRAIGGRWKWPKIANLQYYLEKGFNIFRVPFHWDRLQLEARASLDEAAMGGLDEIVNVATSAGAVIVLDSHDYGRRDKLEIGAPNSPYSAEDFADFWGRLARRYKNNKLVWYGLMNEPHNQDAQLNLKVQNAACAAIRRSGARSMVLFSGISWTGAKSWVPSGNGRVMLGASDPLGNYGFDVHQYFKKSHLGRELKDLPGIGTKIMSRLYDWAKENNKKVFLGEFGINENPLSMKEVENAISYMASHTDVFIGATYFAGGGTWGRNPNSSDPIDGVDKPQTRMLRKYL